ncbi:MAG TPA: AAA family ATPase [Thermoleophilia bacterium]
MGREEELAQLLDAFDEAAVSHQAQFVLLVGEPGIGKSRLVLELARTLDQRPGLVIWRQGRCPGYGEAVTFWALGEIVKTHGGILDSDERQAVEDKLKAVLPTGDEEAWLRQRLRPLLGLEAPQASREEAFAAWRRFLEIVATPGPAVIVLEDMHWADDALLDFTEYLGTEGMDAPVLVLAPARPELTERRPHLLAPRDGVSRLVLHPLAPQETKDLLADLLPQWLSEEAGGRIAERVGGNPLYAEEYVRLLADRGLAGVDDVGQAMESDGQLLPDTVQAVIAARLDALPPARKALLCDAAVIGETFWLGAVASLARRSRAEVGEELERLVDAELLRQCHSSIEGETAYLFWHALTRDVAYAELPRKIRAVKHAGAAQWIEQQAGERRDDHAETLAYQYLTAHDLAHEARERKLASSLLEPAIHYSGKAGDRLLLVDVRAAERHLARALELAGDGPARLPLLASWGSVLFQRGLHTESVAVLRQAVEGLKAQGDRTGAGRAAMLRTDPLQYTSDTETALESAQEAVDLLDDGHPSVALLEALSGLAWIRANCGDQRSSIEAAQRSIDCAEQWGVPVWPGALGARGAARLALGDLEGLTDYELALEAAKSQGLTFTESALTSNLAYELMAIRGPASALELWRQRLQRDLQHGFDGHALLLRCSIAQALAYTGEWGDALSLADELNDSLERSGNLQDIITLGMVKALVLLLRGDCSEARRLASWAEERTRNDSPGAARYCWQLVAGVAEAHEGQSEAAVRHLGALSTEPLPPNSPEVVLMHPHAIRAAVAVGASRLAGELVGVVGAVRPVNDLVIAAGRALLAENVGELDGGVDKFVAAGRGWRDFGVPYEEAQALLGQGRCLLALGRTREASAPLHAAREIFARLGARPARAETDKLLLKVASA